MLNPDFTLFVARNFNVRGSLWHGKQRNRAMRSNVLAIVTAVTTVAFAGAAHTQSSQTSSASFNITVVIPPLAEAIAAREAGAAGDWTVLTDQGGFMIDMPEAVDADDSTLTIFRSDRQRFSLALLSGEGSLSLSPESVDSSRQLTAMSFALPTASMTQQSRLVFAGI